MRRLFDSLYNAFLDWLCDRLGLTALDCDKGDLMSPEW